ncbi:MAG TPA: Mpo1-like protein [Pseudolabrys sp.]|nr:Mpo1-like protein [Pseudolabrys sp.]
MHEFFRRQLGIYADYHRDERNHLTHLFGIPIIFLAIILPLSLWPVTAFGVSGNAAMVTVIPALVVWLLLDVAIGLAIVAAVVPLVLLAKVIADHFGTFDVWSIAAGLFCIGWALQILGHTLFEHRKPALLDNPMHLLIGPMFVVAKLLVALGFRRDLAFAVEPKIQQAES